MKIYCVLMKKETKKYIIKESELKDILKEMVLYELFNPNDYNDTMKLPDDYVKSIRPNGQDVKLPNFGDAINMFGSLIKGIPNALIPDEYKERVANGDVNLGNRIMRWLLGSVGASAAGTVGPDILPNAQEPNPDAHQPFKVARACNWLRTNAKAKSIRKCALYVRTALNVGGLSAPHGHPAGSAKNYIAILPKNGWERIPSYMAGEPGDVVVVDAYTPINGGKSHPDGHIAMCIGNGRRASDFLQNSALGLRNPPPPEKVYFFRYRNRV